MTLISEDSAHDFIVKFSPSVCVAVVASLTREVAVRSFAYHAHGTNPAVILGHDKTLNQQFMLTQACPLMMITLVVTHIHVCIYNVSGYVMFSAPEEGSHMSIGTCNQIVLLGTSM